MRSLAIAFVIIAASDAYAYPQWQFSTGNTRCINCHLSPSGGGLLSDMGRDEAGDSLATFGGDGALLHGVGRAAPDWLEVGGDTRGAFVVHEVDEPGGPEVAAFPMQAELAANIAVAGWSVYGSVGIRGQVRDPDEMVPGQNFQPITASRWISREHYVMWQPESLDTYVRVGRFHAPFGLRMPEHIFYVRRDLGFNLMEETYNISAGHLGESSELHVTAFMPDELRHMGGNEHGVALYYEHQILDETGAIGAQTKLAFRDDITRYIAGGVLKQFVDALDTIFFVETDFVYNTFGPAEVEPTLQLVALAGASWLPVRGVVVSLFGEHQHTDLRVRDARFEAGSLQLSWFPYAHVELQAMGRLQLVGGGEQAKTLLVQVHYFL